MIYDIPKAWGHTPEAKRLRAAQAAWAEVTKEFHQQLMTRTEFTPEHRARSRTVRQEVEAAQAALDVVTGEPGRAELTQTVINKVRADYADYTEDEQAEVMDLLDRKCGRNLPFMRKSNAGKLEPTQMAVLKLAKEEKDRLQEMIDAAKLDWKDVQMTAYCLDYSLDDLLDDDKEETRQA